MLLQPPMTPSAPPQLTPYPYGGTPLSHPSTAATRNGNPFQHNYPACQPLATSPLHLADFDPLPAKAEDRQLTSPQPRMLTTHQAKGVATFTGKAKHGPRLEDWIRDIRFLLESKGTARGLLQFHEVVRYTGGRARDVLLNLESRAPEGLDAEAAFSELLEEYGEDRSALSPVAKFYSRVQRENETPTEFAIALEATLREVEEARRRRGQSYSEEENRDKMLATQFMCGLRDLRYKQRLAPMQPRSMSFRDVRRELHIIAEEERQAEEIRRRRAPLYTMSEVAQSLPQVKVQGAKGPEKPTQSVKEAGPREQNDSDMLPLQQLLAQQMDEVKSLCREQVEALGRVLREQRQEGQQLMQLEAAVLQPRIVGQPLQRSPFSGCFRCGNKGHLARNCPEERRLPAQASHVTRPNGPVHTQPIPSPTTQPQIQQTTASPLNEQNLRM